MLSDSVRDASSGGIQPKPTDYAGIEFRSRLEARWAFFFDQLGIRWEYEPECYELEMTPGKVWRYLPDFHLPDLNVWCEVKGDTAAVSKDYLHMLGHVGHMLPGVNNSSGTSGVVLLGNFPDPAKIKVCRVVHLLVSHYKGCHVDWFSFTANPAHFWTTEAKLRVDPWPSQEFDEWALGTQDPTELWAPHRIHGYLTPLKVLEAYTAARRHRFWDPK